MVVLFEISLHLQDQGTQGQDTRVRYGSPDGTPAPAEATPGIATTSQQPAPGGGGPPPDPMAGCYSQLPFFIPIILLMYFLMIRPQQKQEKARKAMLSKIQRGDRVVTSSGVHGVIASVSDDTVQILIDGDGKVKVTVDRSAVGRVVGNEPATKGNGTGREKAAG